MIAKRGQGRGNFRVSTIGERDSCRSATPMALAAEQGGHVRMSSSTRLSIGSRFRFRSATKGAREYSHGDVPGLHVLEEALQITHLSAPGQPTPSTG
jgi:hypothetical protein